MTSQQILENLYSLIESQYVMDSYQTNKELDPIEEFHFTINNLGILAIREIEAKFPNYTIIQMTKPNRDENERGFVFEMRLKK